jgi:NADH-quinone oxidoreductase subunit J
MTEAVFFYSFAALTLIGAVLTVTLRNAIHCAIALISSLAGVAGLYLMQKAEFLFAVQIVLYIGGIMVLFLFVIMLVNLDSAAKQRQYHRQWIAGALSLAGTGALIIWFLNKGQKTLEAMPAAANVAPTVDPRSGNTQQIADVLFSEYLLPFEVVSILLLVAIVGSVLMAKKRVS